MKQQSQKYQPFFRKTTAYVIMAIDMQPTGQSCATPIVTKLSQSCLNDVPQFYQIFLQVFSKQFQKFGKSSTKVVSKLSQSSPKFVSKLCRRFLKDLLLQMAPSDLQVVQSVYYVVPQWCQVVSIYVKCFLCSSFDYETLGPK